MLTSYYIKSRSLFNDSIELSIDPKALFENLTFLTKQCPLTILSTILPITAIILFGGIVESSQPLLPSVLVIPLVGRSISPGEFTMSMIFPILPFSFIYRAIQKLGYSRSLRCKVMNIYFSQILSSIIVDYLGFVLGVVVELNSIRFRLFRVVDLSDASQRLRTRVEFALKGVEVFCTVHFTMSLYSAEAEFSLIDEFVGQRLKHSFAGRH